MGKDILDRASPTIIAGYGKMGAIYLDELIGMGIDPCKVAIVDINLARFAHLADKHPRIFCTAEMEVALAWAKPKTAFVLTNTPFHARIIKDLITGGVENIFAEKPLVGSADEAEEIRKLMGPSVKIYTAYLINFSSATDLLCNFMRQKSLYVSEFRGVWSKNRTGDGRMTPGNFEDEKAHMERFALMLVEQNQKIQSISTWTLISHAHYVDEEAQSSARVFDRSIPERPSSSAQIGLKISTDILPSVSVMMTSSFLDTKQRRSVQVAFTHNPSDNRVAYLAEINFDNPDGTDSLLIIEAGKKRGKITDKSFPGGEKLRNEIAAFFQAASGGERNPRLTGLDEAAFLVELVHAEETSYKESRIVTLNR